MLNISEFIENLWPPHFETLFLKNKLHREICIGWRGDNSLSIAMDVPYEAASTASKILCTRKFCVHFADLYWSAAERSAPGQNWVHTPSPGFSWNRHGGAIETSISRTDLGLIRGICIFKWLRWVTFKSDLCFHVVVKWSTEAQKHLWAANFLKHCPKQWSVHCVECFCKV